MEGDIVYQYSFKGQPWVECSESEWEGRLGNWDFSLRKLAKLGSDIKGIEDDG